MKKSLLLAFGLMVVVSLAACWIKNGDDLDDNDYVGDQDSEILGENEEIDDWYEDPLDYIYGKMSFTLEDLDDIDEYRFPVSYRYVVYGWDEAWVLGSWEYVYPEDVSQRLLLPIYENMEKRELISSVVDHDRINTIVSITLQNWEIYSVKFINDPETLKYVGASLNTQTGTILYTFNY